MATYHGEHGKALQSVNIINPLFHVIIFFVQR